MNVFHNAVQFCIDFFPRPRIAHGILTHFKARYGNAAGIGRFARCKQHAFLLENGNGIRRTRHIGAFGNQLHAVCDKGTRIVDRQFVLRRARESAIDAYRPRTLTRAIFGIRICFNVFAYAAALNVFKVLYKRKLFGVYAVFIVNKARRIRHRKRFCPALNKFLHGKLRNVTASRNGTAQAFKRFVFDGEHIRGKVNQAVAGCFGTDERAAVRAALSGKHARKFVAYALVLAEHIADFAGAHPDIACRHVRVGADVAIQFGHKRLTKTHNFAVAFPVRIKIGTALCAAHGQRRQAVFKSLFEAQKLQYAQIDGRMEADAAFIRADRSVKLNAVAPVHLNRALVVDPRNTEYNGAVGFDTALQNSVPFEFRHLFGNDFQRFKHFANRLQKFRLGRIFRLHLIPYSLNICVFHDYLAVQCAYFITRAFTVQVRSRTSA